MSDVKRIVVEVDKANDTVTMNMERYVELLESENFLSALEACGVDNWGGYSDARQMMQDNDD